ncbi:MAG: helical backbone metal receptor, partial [Desulfovermiculus sp.]
MHSPPQRAVSLVPSATEIIFALGAGDQLKGVTAHTNKPAAVHTKQIVGGYFAPCLETIESLNPDVIFTSSLHDQVREHFADSKVQVITLNTTSVEDSFKEIRLLGRIFGRETKAAAIVEDIRDRLDLIQAKTSRIPEDKRKRVIRLMGRDRVMTPGSDSFQNEFIRLAGGISPDWTKEGSVVPVSKKEWQEFDPQIIYGCGGDRRAAEKLLSRSDWKDVQAVREGNIFWFPCALTCRAATHSGDFVSWLASRVYAQEFGQGDNLVRKEEVVNSRSLDVPLSYVQEARVTTSRILDFENRTLIIDFSRPMQIVSTLEGQLNGIRTVGNHYSPPPCWSLGHAKGLERVRSQVYEVLGIDPQRSSFLFTGADMNNLAVQSQKHRDLSVTALVTAGVRSNALRMSRDAGGFYEPGTINILLLPNMQLSQRAMTRAIVSATEAKTAALQDLDIRSSYSGTEHQATGTGTDNVLVAEGSGQELDNAGGHSKLGELIARAVYAGVQEAVGKQNGVSGKRSLFHRLQERDISMYELVAGMDRPESVGKRELLAEVYKILLQPEYAGFLQAAFSVSDSDEQGLIQDLGQFQDWSRQVAKDIAGGPVVWRDQVAMELPPALET